MSEVVYAKDRIDDRLKKGEVIKTETNYSGMQTKVICYVRFDYIKDIDNYDLLQGFYSENLIRKEDIIKSFDNGLDDSFYITVEERKKVHRTSYLNKNTVIDFIKKTKQENEKGYYLNIITPKNKTEIESEAV